jgi:hypothetical protein
MKNFLIIAAAAILSSCDDRSDSTLVGADNTGDVGEIEKTGEVVTNQIKVNGRYNFEIVTVKIDSSEWIIISHPNGVALKEKTR